MLSVNDKEINTIFNLGMLYEKTGKKDDAIAQYTKLISLLPDSSADTKSQIQKMITNVKNGVANTPESLGLNQQNQGSASTSGQ